jgi:hypothetical protein
MAVTGALLNHAEDLGWHKKPVQARWLYRWYGLEPAGTPVGYAIGDNLVGGWGGWLYVGAGRTARLATPVGAVDTGMGWAVASAGELVVVTPEGELVERLTALPQGAIEALGRDPDGRIWLRTARGCWAAGADLGAWAPVEPGTEAQVRWSQALALPAEVDAQWREAWVGEGLTWQRVLLDLHTGRLWGWRGAWLTDVLALGLLVLVVSGLVVAWRARRTRRCHR